MLTIRKRIVKEPLNFNTEFSVIRLLEIQQAQKPRFKVQLIIQLVLIYAQVEPLTSISDLVNFLLDVGNQ